MLEIQKFTLAFISVPGLLLGIVVAAMSKGGSGLWLFKYGGFLILLGVIPAVVLTNKNFLDVLLFIDTDGFGRAYVIGCMLVFSGTIVEFIHLIKILYKKISGSIRKSE